MKARIRFYAMGQSMASKDIVQNSQFAVLYAGMGRSPQWAKNAFMSGFLDQRRRMPDIEPGGLPAVSRVPHPPVRPLRTSTLDPDGAEHAWLERHGRFYIPGRGIGKAAHVVRISTPLRSESVFEHLASKQELHAAMVYGFDFAGGPDMAWEISMETMLKPGAPLSAPDLTAGTNGPSNKHDGTE